MFLSYLPSIWAFQHSAEHAKLLPAELLESSKQHGQTMCPELPRNCSLDSGEEKTEDTKTISELSTLNFRLPTHAILLVRSSHTSCASFFSQSLCTIISVALLLALSQARTPVQHPATLYETGQVVHVLQPLKHVEAPVEHIVP